jgi:phage terminase small subunit
MYLTEVKMTEPEIYFEDKESYIDSEIKDRAYQLNGSFVIDTTGDNIGVKVKDAMIYFKINDNKLTYRRHFTYYL